MSFCGSRGFLLFEVMVGLLLFSLVLLGLEALELFSLKVSWNAYEGSAADLQMENMKARLRVLEGGEGLSGEVEKWNEENEMVLPRGKGEVLGAYPRYELRLLYGKADQAYCEARQWEVRGCAKETFNL